MNTIFWSNEKMSKTYRDKMDIISNVLEAANGGATKIRIMYQALLGHKQMKEYVNFLIEKGLLVSDSHQQEVQIFRTTEKGLQFLDTYNRIRDIISEEQSYLRQQSGYIEEAADRV